MGQLLYGSLSMIALIVAIALYVAGRSADASFTVLIAVVLALWTLAPRPPRPQLPPRP